MDSKSKIKMCKHPDDRLNMSDIARILGIPRYKVSYRQHLLPKPRPEFEYHQRKWLRKDIDEWLKTIRVNEKNQIEKV